VSARAHREAVIVVGVVYLVLVSQMRCAVSPSMSMYREVYVEHADRFNQLRILQRVSRSQNQRNVSKLLEVEGLADGVPRSEGHNE
jgi:hypothetical protein